MFVLLLCCFLQPSNELFSKLDKLFDSQVQELKTQINASEKRASKENNSVLRQAQLTGIAEKKAKLTNLSKNYAVEIPDFDFSKGVEAGDLGSIGYHVIPNNRTTVAPSGQRYATGGGRTELNYKVASVNGKEAVLLIPPYTARNMIIVEDIPGKVSEEQIIYLNKYIAEYLGKQDGMKRYKIIGSQSELAAWKKYRMTKKK